MSCWFVGKINLLEEFVSVDLKRVLEIMGGL